MMYEHFIFTYFISFHLTFPLIAFIKSVNYLNLNLSYFGTNKVLDVKPLVPLLSTRMPIV